MRGILILCGRGWCRKAVIRAPAGAWAAEEDAASRRGRRKRRRWQQRRSKGRHQRDTDGAAEGCAGRSGVREGRRDAGTPGRRGTDEVPEGRRDDEAAAEKGRWQGAGSAGRRGYGQRRERGWPEGVRPTRGGGRRKRRRRRGADCGRERQARAGHKNAAAGGSAAGRRESERGSRKEGRGGGGPAAALNRSIEGPLGGEDGVAEVEGQVHVLPRVDLVLGQRQAHRPDGRVVDQ